MTAHTPISIIHSDTDRSPGQKLFTSYPITMMTETIEQELRHALGHLHDPGYQPPSILYALTGCDPLSGPVAVQSALIRSIEDLKPATGVPASAQSAQSHDVLYNRFVLGLTQEETADRLHRSLSSLRRAQRVAIYTLTQLLWERSETRTPPQSSPDDRTATYNLLPDELVNTQASDWLGQAEHELASLQATAPDGVSDVATTIAGVLELEKALGLQKKVGLKIEFVQPGLSAKLHRSVLRQILITALRRLNQYAVEEPIRIYAGLGDGDVQITISATLSPDNRPAVKDLVGDILTPEGVSVGASIEGIHVFLRVDMPSVGKIDVLVVDDNPDMVRFFRRATEGTHYRTMHLQQARDLFDRVAVAPPDIVVLDVMLPDIDGWELLIRLHEDLETRAIPVIVCSVIREKELALSLGAAAYLPKPVTRRAFIQALDRVLPQTQEEFARPQVSNESSG